MFAHQAGVAEEAEKTWHCGQLGVSEVTERGRERGQASTNKTASASAVKPRTHVQVMTRTIWFIIAS